MRAILGLLAVLVTVESHASCGGWSFPYLHRRSVAIFEADAVGEHSLIVRRAWRGSLRPGELLTLPAEAYDLLLLDQRLNNCKSQYSAYFVDRRYLIFAETLSDLGAGDRTFSPVEAILSERTWKWTCLENRFTARRRDIRHMLERWRRGMVTAEHLSQWLCRADVDDWSDDKSTNDWIISELALYFGQIQKIEKCDSKFITEARGQLIRDLIAGLKAYPGETEERRRREADDGGNSTSRISMPLAVLSIP